MRQCLFGNFPLNTAFFYLIMKELSVNNNKNDTYSHPNNIKNNNNNNTIRLVFLLRRKQKRNEIKSFLCMFLVYDIFVILLSETPVLFFWSCNYSVNSVK